MSQPPTGYGDDLAPTDDEKKGIADKIASELEAAGDEEGAKEFRKRGKNPPPE